MGPIVVIVVDGHGEPKMLYDSTNTRSPAYVEAWDLLKRGVPGHFQGCPITQRELEGMVREALAPWVQPLPPTVPHVERAEHRPCASCGKEIQPGQLYIAKAPFHIGCAPRD